MNEKIALKLLPVLRGLQLYHRYSIEGLHNLPKRGGAIIACTHSLATYDMMLLMASALEFTNRFPRTLVDRLFFKVPGLGNIMEHLGCVMGDPRSARSLLENGDLLFIAPGGMEESLRSSSEKYRINWSGRKGFAKLAVETGAPVVLAACPDADNIFDVSDAAITKWAYQNFRVPLFRAKGLGSSFLPKPVKLRHYLSEAIYPPVVKKGEDFTEIVDAFHAMLTLRMEKLIKSAVDHGNPLNIGKSQDEGDQTVH